MDKIGRGRQEMNMREKIIKEQIKKIESDIRWDQDRIKNQYKRVDESMEYIVDLNERIQANKELVKILWGVMKNGKGKITGTD